VPASQTRQKSPDCSDPAGQAWHGLFSVETVPAGHVWQKKASDRLLYRALCVPCAHEQLARLDPRGEEE
jgi:hypothetical protein